MYITAPPPFRVRFGQSAAYEHISAALGYTATTAHRIADASGRNSVDKYRAASRCNHSPMWRMDRASMRRIGIAYTSQPFAVDENIRAVT